MPLLIVGLLVGMFLILEARRYRYFNVWRARARWLETEFYAPLLLRSKVPDPGEWQDVLAKDYLTPQHHISFLRAMGRRIRRNYMWIFSFQALAYMGKIVIHPTPLASMDQMFERMAVGPLPGVTVFGFGVLFHSAWITLALITRRKDRKKHAGRKGVGGMG